MQGERFTTALDQGGPRVNTPSIIPRNFPKDRSDYIAHVELDIRGERRDKHAKKASWMEIILDIAVAYSQGADV